MKKKKSFLMIIIIFLFVLVIGVTLGFIQGTMQGSKRQVITSAKFFIELEEKDGLIIEDALPMYDEVGMLQESFHFQLINKYNSDIDYVLYLKDVTEEGQEKLAYEDVKYYLTKEDTKYEPKLLTELENWKLDEGRSAANSVIHYTLSFWIKSEVTTNEQIENKVLKFKLQMDTTNDTRERYTIKYETGTGTVIEEEIKIEGENFVIPSVHLEKEGYIFLGWSTKEGSNVAEYAPNGIFQGNLNTTFYAVWVEALYAVTYDANTGIDPPVSQEKEYGKPLIITSDIPSKTGYTFQGWSTSPNGAVEYQPNSSYEKDENITLYAVWKINTYTVSYNANGGSGAPSAQTKTYGTTLQLSSTKPTRTGYTFQGWSTSSSGSVAYSAGGNFTTNANTTLYAVWKINTYTVSYNANGGSGAPGAQTKTYGTTLKLSSTKPTRTGYTFQGWSTSSSGSVAYSAGGNFTTNANTTLYAVWKINTYTVSYNANGGSGAPSAQTKTYGTTLKLSSTKPTRTGYVFQGWSTSSSGSVAYSAGGSFTANANTTLYAIWKEDVLMIYNQGTRNIALTMIGPGASWGSSSIIFNKSTNTEDSTHLYSTNKIDITKYKKLYVKGNFYIIHGEGNSSNFGFGMASSQNRDDAGYVGNYWFRNAISTLTNVTNTTFSVDISSLSGSYYLKMKSWSSTVTITQIWLSAV